MPMRASMIGERGAPSASSLLAHGPVGDAQRSVDYKQIRLDL
jgi:hypothetical protein